MRTLLVSVAPWLLSLATCLSASAQTQTQPRSSTDRGNDRNAGKQETIRGVIAGVTVAGEMAVNYRTNRAEAVEMSYLTIIGSPVRDKMFGKETSAARTSEERGRDRARGEPLRQAERHRHNVYIVWLTPNTKVLAANEPGTGQVNTRNNEQESAQRSKEMNWEQLEVGDHVEVTFTRREATASDTAVAGTAQSRKHGRHRTYFGDAVSVNILPESQSHHFGSSTEKERGEHK
jgi:hypothetical protein